MVGSGGATSRPGAAGGAGPAPLGATTLVARWEGHAARSPGRPALLVGPAGAAADGRRGRTPVGYGELAEAAADGAGRLAAAGLVAGARAVWAAAPSTTSVVAALAVLRAGGVLVPLNPAYTAREVDHVLSDVRPSLVVTDAPGVRDRAGPLPVLTPSLEPWPGTPAMPGGAAAVPAPPGPGDPALIVYTSGTTGRPKGAVLSHGNLAAGADSLAQAWEWGPEDRLVLALPLFHVHGLCAGLLGTLAAGAAAVLVSPFEPATVLAEAAGATLFFGVPTMYHRLLAHGGARALGALRLCVSGSAALPPSLWRRVRDEAGAVVLERYGMTETLLTLSNPLHGERRPGTVGVPLPGVSVRLRAAGGAGDDADEGELWVRGPSVFGGYWERPEATAAAFEDGWFATGDAAARDPDGYLRILGRRGDLIISGGFNVYPAEVEEVLLRHPSVAEVAVVGEPSDEWGESVCAVVVGSAGAPPLDDLAAHCAGLLAPYKRPRRYRVVDALPRNAMGKVLRRELEGKGPS